MPSSATAVREGNHVKSAPGTGARTGGNSSAHSSLGVSNGTDAAICQEGGSAGSAPAVPGGRGRTGRERVHEREMDAGRRPWHGMAWHHSGAGKECSRRRRSEGGSGEKQQRQRPRVQNERGSEFARSLARFWGVIDSEGRREGERGRGARQGRAGLRLRASERESERRKMVRFLLLRALILKQQQQQDQDNRDGSPAPAFGGDWITVE
ncbi:hypothetical protein AXG93_1989s1030 [Marchantia polymorpha subsp. ruderalis]|uniref:Uncharacterized protein n=1 Tax=Marchantia polymorpha subsp. ruderalis TaxID=1480154 RepID=A0A176VNR0_MARPO|nr:hypothetical protein AXG93_1989s1030 [Marchantia polymorpha subsp. ruderalis]